MSVAGRLPAQHLAAAAALLAAHVFSSLCDGVFEWSAKQGSAATSRVPGTRYKLYIATPAALMGELYFSTHLNISRE